MRRRLRAQLRDLKHETNFSGIYVTHDQEEAMELADTLAVMESGKIRQIGAGRDVYERPNSLYVAGFVGEVNNWPGEIVELRADSALVKTAFGAFEIRVSPSSLAVAQTGALAIRPERVGLAAPGGDASSGDPRLRGRVKDVLFLGARCEVRVEIDGGVELNAWLFEAATHRSPPLIGADVDVIFESASLQWLGP